MVCPRFGAKFCKVIKALSAFVEPLFPNGEPVFSGIVALFEDLITEKAVDGGWQLVIFLKPNCHLPSVRTAIL